MFKQLPNGLWLDVETGEVIDWEELCVRVIVPMRTYILT